MQTDASFGTPLPGNAVKSEWDPDRGKARRWRLWRAAAWGGGLGAGYVLLKNTAFPDQDWSLWELQPLEAALYMVGLALGGATPAALLFVLVAVIRNYANRRFIRGSDV